MPLKKVLILSVLLLFISINMHGQARSPAEKICGKWESTGKNLTIQIFSQGGQFKAIILWYADTEGKPLDYWTDIHNPNPSLRSRKILGMSILRGLTYDSKTDTWENGMVYDSKHGREWNASAYIGKYGLLRVRG